MADDVTPTAGRVSVVMPAYNAARHIAETIDTVLAQTYPNWELLAVDDGSTDDTAAVVQGYCARDPRIRYFYQTNARQGRARNNALGHATGEFVAFLDSDDLWLPDKLTVQLRDLQASGADMVFCDTYLFSSKFNLSPTTPRLGTQAATYEGTEGLRQFLAANRVPMLTALCRREALTQAGNFIEDRPVQNAEDYHLWLRMLVQGCRLVGYDYALAAYRQHAASVSDPDGLNLRHAIEAQAAIAAQYSAAQALVAESLPRAIGHSLGQLAAGKPELVVPTIVRYLELLGKGRYAPVFKLLGRLNNPRLAVRAAYFVLNRL